jgi:hypothetical protein
MALARAGLPAPAAAAVGAMISTAVESAMQGQTPVLESEIESGMTSVVFTSLTGGLIPMKGASPSLTAARNQPGINSKKILGQEGLAGALGDLTDIARRVKAKNEGKQRPSDCDCK